MEIENKKIVVAANIIGSENSREIRGERDEKTGMFKRLYPVEGTERCSLLLELPGGVVIQAQVSPEDFEHFDAAFAKQALAMGITPFDAEQHSP